MQAVPQQRGPAAAASTGLQSGQPPALYQYTRHDDYKTQGHRTKMVRG